MRSQTFRRVVVFLFLTSLGGAIIVSMGCVRSQYHYGLGQAVDSNQISGMTTSEILVTMGGDYPRLDRVERAVQAPKKIFSRLFGPNSKSPDDSDQRRQRSIELSQEYLAKNDLHDVYLDVRQYDPKEQWSRTKANQRMAPAWKYTGGALNWAMYTMLPLRVLGADHYDPFTNTLSINSAKPTRALYEAGAAKQFRRQPYLGTYTALQKVPFVPLFHHAEVTSDVLTYAHVNEYWQLKKELYPTTYSGFGSAAVSQIAPWRSDSTFYSTALMSMAGGVIGGLTGSAVAAQTKDEPSSQNLAPHGADPG